MAASRGRQRCAKTALIERLIGEARALPNVSERIDFISRKLLGIRYQANTLIGGPKQPEKFVVRDDAFDCVTFCEVVLAAAIARDMAEFETVAPPHPLRPRQRAIRPAQSLFRRLVQAQHRERHLPAGRDRAVDGDRQDRSPGTASSASTRCRSVAIAKETLLANAKLLAPGDIIGFTSRRAGLDYYHTGLVAFGKNGELLLRNASQSRGRVVEDKMAAFVTANPVKYVTLLRAAENAPVAERR